MVEKNEKWKNILSGILVVMASLVVVVEQQCGACIVTILDSMVGLEYITSILIPIVQLDLFQMIVVTR